MSARQQIILTIVLLLATIAPFTAPPIPVGTDTPKQLMIARIVAEYHNPVLAYARDYTLDLKPRSTVFATLALAALVKVMDPFLAVRVLFALFVLALWLAGRFLAVSAGLPSITALLLLPLAHTLYVFSGFVPFVFAVAVYPVLLGLLLGKASGWKRWGIAAGALLLLYSLHIVGWAIGCLSVAVAAFVRGDRKLGLCDMTAILPSAIVSGMFLLSRESGYSQWQYQSPVRHVLSYFVYNAATLSRVATYAALLLFAMFVTWIGYALVRGRGQRWLLLLCCGLIAAGICLPVQIADWFIVGARTFPFAVIIGITGLRMTGSALFRSVLLATAYILISSVLNTVCAMAVQSKYNQFLAGLPYVRYGSRILPIVEDLSLGGNQFIQPFAGIEDAYNIYRGGSNPYTFTYPNLRTGAATLRLLWGRTHVGKYSSNTVDYHGVSKKYDYVLLVGRLQDVRHQVSSEMCQIYRNDLITLYDRCADIKVSRRASGSRPDINVR